MTRSTRAFVSAGLMGASLLGVASVARATASSDPVVLVRQDSDGALWYDWYETPANRTFLTTSRPCWVDHDHVRLGAQNRRGCSTTRP